MTGLSGLGDLVLTCGSPQSRNMSLGIALGEGQSLEDVLQVAPLGHRGRLYRGAVVEMAAARGIDMPIAQAVHAVISGLATVDEAIEALLARPLRPEGSQDQWTVRHARAIASSQGGNRMLYALICTDKPDSLALRKANRPEHVRYLQSLGDRSCSPAPSPRPTARP